MVERAELRDWMRHDKLYNIHRRCLTGQELHQAVMTLWSDQKASRSGKGLPRSKLNNLAPLLGILLPCPRRNDNNLNQRCEWSKRLPYKVFPTPLFGTNCAQADFRKPYNILPLFESS